MEFSGRIIQKLELQTGVSKVGNEWKKQDIVLDQDTNNPMYPKRVCITFFGDRADMLANLDEGMQVRVQADVESREYNGRWYTNVNGYRIDPGERQDAPMSQGNQGVAMSDIGSMANEGPGIVAPTTNIDTQFNTSEGADDLPF